jgi:hypothetical protein
VSGFPAMVNLIRNEGERDFVISFTMERYHLHFYWPAAQPGVRAAPVDKSKKIASHFLPQHLLEKSMKNSR